MFFFFPEMVRFLIYGRFGRFCVPLFFFYLSNSLCYIINVSVDSKPGTVIFNASLNSLRTDRRYILSSYQNAQFVYDLFHVNEHTGKVVLKRYLNCDGILYPRLFTLYVESMPTWLRNINYCSLPLRVFVNGVNCNDQRFVSIESKENNNQSKYFNSQFSKKKYVFINRDHITRNSNLTKIAIFYKAFGMKNWISQTIASFAIYMTDNIDKICFKKSQFISNLQNFIPQTILYECKIRFIAISDFRFEIESKNYDIIATANICVSETIFKVLVTLDLSCSEMYGNKMNHQIGIIYHQHKLNNTDLATRVRRELTNQSPFFEKNLYIGYVLEESVPGEVVITIQAHDPENSPLLYHMTSILDSRSQSFFAIDSHTGVVTTTTSLDREEMQVHYFQIIASDESFLPRSGTTTLQINVEDSNDNYPLFEKDNMNATIWEGSPIGTAVITVRATDQDSGKNSEIEYIIEYITDVGHINKERDVTEFNVNPKTGIISTNTVLDREEADIYTIFVVAQDSPIASYNRKSTTATIFVRVLDENDNYPQFQERVYSVQIKEDERYNKVIAHIKASDADDGSNAAIRYAIITGNTQAHFSIDSVSGEVTLVKLLDYEIIQSFRLVVRAQDGGSPSRSNTTQLLVQVIDVNDNAPKFYVAQFQESVLESVPNGYNVIRVQAYDPDDGLNAEIQYSLRDNDEYFPFVVDEKTGWIHTKRQLDRENCSRFAFQVIAFDRGDPPMSASANVIVIVQDVNDNDPLFQTKYYEVAIREDLPPGSSVLTVSATDPDENSRLHYDIISGNIRARFAINIQNGKGIITVAQPLDYKQEAHFLLTITATDLGGRLDTAYININITDVNNFAPVFENSPYSAVVMEDIPIGTTVLIVSAVDNDSGINAQITYVLEESANGYGHKYPFSIHPKTGAISTIYNLDREQSSSYLLAVRAVDAGIPNLSDTTDVEIVVSDVNDNAPEFETSEYRVSISEDVTIGTFVIQVYAQDIDSGSNGQVIYLLDEENIVEGSFIVDSVSGTIRTNKLLDRESCSEHDVVVIANDKGTPSQSASVHVVIKLEDINDSAPSFSTDKIIMYVQENSPIGSTVGTIEAKDPDEGVNAIIQYSIVGGIDSNLFALVPNIESNCADIITMTPIDYESQKKRFEIMIRAASPPLRNDVYVEILVIDVNDNVPILKNFKIIFNNYQDHFPVGEIGRIPAFDADISDHLEFKVFSGNYANFINVNTSTGGITLSPQLNTNVPRFVVMGIYVSDGINEITSTMQLYVRLITEEVLSNSVTVRLNELSVEAFLSAMLDLFIDSVAVIIPCPKENIILFSIQEDHEYTVKIVAVTFSIIIPNLHKEMFFSIDYLQEHIHLNRATLNQIAGLTFLPFEDSLCVKEPCLNFEQCTTVLKYGNASAFMCSDTLLFRPIHPVKHFACHCPPGFAGSIEHYLCDREVDLCYSNPCHNNGSCYKLEGGYTCICGKDYTGKNCEKKVDIKLCANETCKLCTFSEVTHLHLQEATQICGLKSRSFGQTSFITFRSLKSRYRFTIKLKFATLESNALLYYNGRYNDLHDFIALAIINGQVCFSFSLGGTKQLVKVHQSKLICDGMWHTVEVTYYNRTATVAIDNCDKILGLKMNLNREWNCVNQSTLLLAKKCSSLTAPCYRFLDLTGPFQLGGLSMRPKHYPLEVNEFVGCISDFFIDDRFVDLNFFLSENGTSEGCSQKASHCKSEPCLNGGICVDGWNRPLCVCPQEYTGHICQETTSSPWRLSNGSFLNFSPLLRPIQFPWHFGLSIRTLQENSSLLQIQIGQNSSIILTLENGILHLFYKTHYIHLQTFSLSDGNWHRIDVYCIDSYIKFSIDYDQRTSFHTFYKNIQGQYIGKIKLGIFDYTLVNLGYFANYNGCIQDVRVGGVQNIRNMHSVSEKIESGCSSKADCSKNCPVNSACVKKWDEAFCECKKGHIGSSCIPVCELHPCNSGKCRIDSELPKFYRCDCNGTSDYGEHCEHSVELPCPTGWWGEKICGPCKCDIHRGYNPDCNKKTGQCYCKDNHFQQFNSSVCLPCNCYALGSLGSTCDILTGQCICREGVIGRRCDSCTNIYAEVTLSGCAVVYDACPRSYSSGIWWKRTSLGKIAAQDCPTTAKGLALRACDGDIGRWSNASLFNCTSKPFIELKRNLEQIETGQLELNSFLSIKLVHNLKKACEIVSEIIETNSRMPDEIEFVHTKLYGMDVLVIEKLLHYIIKFESTMHGLNLSHSQDKNFVDNIVFIASIILSNTYDSIWIQIKETTLRGPQDLLELFNEYMIKLGESQYDIFYTPFEVVHENMALGLDIIPINVSTTDIAIDPGTPEIKKGTYEGKNSNFYRTTGTYQHIKGQNLFMTIPKYDNYMQDKTKFDRNTKVFLPISLLKMHAASEAISKSFDCRTVVVYAQYKDGSIFPKHYDETISRQWGENIRIASTIFTLQILKPYIEERSLLFDTLTQFTVVSVMQKPNSSNNVKTSSSGLIDKSFESKSNNGLVSKSLQSEILHYPIILQIMININESKFLSKLNPQCVRWNKVSNSWTRIGCHTESPGYKIHKDEKSIYINCTCNQGSTYSVLVDIIDIKETFEISLKTKFGVWTSYILSLFLLAVVSITLLLVKGRKTNSINIRQYTVVSTFSAELFFFIGIQTQYALSHKSFLCKFVGVALHYFWLSAFVWMMLDCFHLYRMLTEMRNINHGPMRFYISVGFGGPAIIICIAVGLRTYEYGNNLFCWLSLYEPLAWCLFGPICAMACICLFLLFMCIKSAFTLKGHILGCGNLRNLLFQCVIALPLMTSTWILSVLSTYKSSEFFIKLLCCAALLHSTFILITNCINTQTRKNLYLGYLKCLRKNVPVVESLHTTHSFEKGSVRKSLYSYPLKHNIGISTSSTTSRSTGKTNSSFRRTDTHLPVTVMNVPIHVFDKHNLLQAQQISKIDANNIFQQNEQGILSVDTESRILELASSHSSDDDEPRIHERFKLEIANTKELKSASIEYRTPVVSTWKHYEDFSLSTPAHKTVLPLHNNENCLHGSSGRISCYESIFKNPSEFQAMSFDETDELQKNMNKPSNNINLSLKRKCLNDELGTTINVYSTEEKSFGCINDIKTSSRLEICDGLPHQSSFNRNFSLVNVEDMKKGDLSKQEEGFNINANYDVNGRIMVFNREQENVFPFTAEPDNAEADLFVIPSKKIRILEKLAIKKEAAEDLSVSIDTVTDNAPLNCDSLHQVEETIV